MPKRLRVPLFVSSIFALLAPALLLPPAVALAQGSKTYVILLVNGADGRVSHKPIADKEQDAFRKSAEEEYQKAKRRWQEEKKAFQKAEKGKKFEKPEPQKPRIQVAKRGIKTYNEAVKIAFDLDRNLEKKNGKNGKAKGGNGSSGNGKNGNGNNGADQKNGPPNEKKKEEGKPQQKQNH